MGSDDLDKLALTETQINVLIVVARFIDAAAGEGVGFEVEFEDGSSGHAFADDIAASVADAFGFDLTESAEPLGLAMRLALKAHIERNEG